MPSAPAEASLLPDSVAQLATVIGWLAALALVEAFPGQTLVIGPRSSETMAKVEAAVGAAATQTLADTYSGAPLYVPACAGLARAERNRRIRAEVRALERTMSTRRAVTQTARKWHCTERTVWRALSPATAATATAPAVATLYQLPLI